MSPEKIYLGDGVYADFDGYQVRLTTWDGIEVKNTIWMDLEMIELLMKWAHKVSQSPPTESDRE
jgi:hypothetical protein